MWPCTHASKLSVKIHSLSPTAFTANVTNDVSLPTWAPPSPHIPGE